MEFPSKPSPLPVTPLGLRLGIFRSDQSRAAARALHDGNIADDQENRMRVIVEYTGKPVTLETSTGKRYQCTDLDCPGKTLIVEVIELDGANPTEAQSRKIERWIRKVPVDGKTYSFDEHGS
jgi:hypothetical protein